MIVLVYCLSTVILWGFWGFFGKLALERGMAPLPVLAIESVTSAICVGLVLAAVRVGDCNPAGIASWNMFGVLSGVSLALGLLFYYFALQRGQVALVVAVTSTYPVVATLLSAVFLKERLLPIHWVGLILIVVGVMLLVGGANMLPRHD